MKEKILIVIIGLVTLVLVNSPFIYFEIYHKEGFSFLGRRTINSEDTYPYLSFIEQARQGRVLFENQYTTEPQKATLIRPSYLIIGKFAKIFNISSQFSYHLARIILSVILFFVVYKFLGRFFKDPNKKVLAFFIVALSSGVGGTSLWVSESLTFLALGEAPHFILSLILILLGYGFFLDFLETKKLKYVAFYGIAFLFLSFEHPFDLIVVGPVIFVTAFINNKHFVRSALIAIASCFGAGIQVLMTLNNPILRVWQMQNIILSPSPTEFFLGLGILIPLAIFGINKISGEVKWKFICVWIFITAIFVYSPISFQLKLLEGFHVPLSILATLGIIEILPRLKNYKEDFIVLVLFLLPLGSIYVTFNDFKAISDTQNLHYYFIDKDEESAIYWLGTKTNFNDVIFSNRGYGNTIPGFIGRKVYLGHTIQTISIDKKISQANLFLLQKDDTKAISFLTTNKITYIFIGKNDPLTSYGFKPETHKYLVKVYDKNGVTIYKVK